MVFTKTNFRNLGHPLFGVLGAHYLLLNFGVCVESDAVILKPKMTGGTPEVRPVKINLINF